jgi:hypothetical protein
MKIKMNSLWFILDKRFRTTHFPDEGYESKQEALNVIESWKKFITIDYYYVADFYSVQYDIINNASFIEDY